MQPGTSLQNDQDPAVNNGCNDLPLQYDWYYKGQELTDELLRGTLTRSRRQLALLTRLICGSAVLEGFELATDDVLRLTPGVAVDSLGRVIVVPSPTEIEPLFPPLPANQQKLAVDLYLEAKIVFRKQNVTIDGQVTEQTPDYQIHGDIRAVVDPKQVSTAPLSDFRTFTINASPQPFSDEVFLRRIHLCKHNNIWRIDHDSHSPSDCRETVPFCSLTKINQFLFETSFHTPMTIVCIAGDGQNLPIYVEHSLRFKVIDCRGNGVADAELSIHGLWGGIQWRTTENDNWDSESHQVRTQSNGEVEVKCRLTQTGRHDIRVRLSDPADSSLLHSFPLSLYLYGQELLMIHGPSTVYGLVHTLVKLCVKYRRVPGVRQDVKFEFIEATSSKPCPIEVNEGELSEFVITEIDWIPPCPGVHHVTIRLLISDHTTPAFLTAGDVQFVVIAVNSRIQVLKGNGQSGPVNNPLPNAIELVVIGADGRPIRSAVMAVSNHNSESSTLEMDELFTENGQKDLKTRSAGHGSNPRGVVGWTMHKPGLHSFTVTHVSVESDRKPISDPVTVFAYGNHPSDQTE